MANIGIDASSGIGNALRDILLADDIQPGSDVSYGVCKALYLYHPLGGKLAEKPVTLAMSMPREITVQNSPGDLVKEAFEKQWKADGCNNAIAGVGAQSRAYGVCSLIAVARDEDTTKEIDLWKVGDLEIVYNVADPLNTAGSLVSNQDPNSETFQKHVGLRVAGHAYHRSRCVTLMNERPIYLAYTSSGFGYVGRSCYQRAMFPLKTFIKTMVTDDMVATKAGLIVAMLKNAASATDRMMEIFSGIKRRLLKEAKVDNVITIGSEEKIESIDLKNLEAPLAMARRNCLENCASANNMPAKIITEEALSSSLNEGTEEAKQIAQYLDGERERLGPVYDFLDEITMHRAWNKAFIESIKSQFPEEYGGLDYQAIFYRWKNSFKATWPSLIREPESKQVEVSKVKFEAMGSAFQLLAPQLDPENKTRLIQWFVDNMNDEKILFPEHLDIDPEALATFTPPNVGGEAEDEPEAKDMAMSVKDDLGEVCYLPAAE